MGTKRRRVGGGMEENTMAILDTSCFSKSTEHLADDRLSFLVAVRSNSLVTENASAPPTNQIYKAILQILKVERSLDLIMSSYQLLIELDKRFPQAWCPFSFGTDVTCSQKLDDEKISGSIDVAEFHLLIEKLSKVPDQANTEIPTSEHLRNMLLFQYLVDALEADLVPRNLAFTENSDWVSLRESLLNMILVSRKITYKGLVKDCLSTMCELSQFSAKWSHDMRPAVTGSTKIAEKCHTTLALALSEEVKRTCAAVQKLLIMIIELDSSKKAADREGWTTRADGTRTPATEIILDELTYDKTILFPFFQALDKPKLKLDMIIQYLKKYIPKASTRTRRSSGSANDSTFGGVLNCFSNENSTTNIIKKISSEVAQLLLAHAFEAYIMLPSEHSTESKEDNSLPHICNNMISAFTCIKRADKNTAIASFGKEALFTAAAMLLRKS